MYIKKLVGNKCYLSPMESNDAEKFCEWLNDPEVFTYTEFAVQALSVEKEREILPSLSKGHNYSIIDKQNNELIGTCGLMNIDSINQTAETGIFIGNKDYRDKGYGSEALSLLIDYAFRYLNLYNIMLRVYSFNERGISCYEKIGFKKIGERRNALRRDLKSYNVVFMDIIPDDFYKNE